MGDNEEELAKTAKKEREEQERAAQGIRALVRTEGWNVLEAALQSAKSMWTSVALRPATSEAGALQTEFAKGAVHGLTLALNLPSNIIGAAQISEADATAEQGNE